MTQAQKDRKVHVPLDLIEQHPDLLDRILDTLDGKPLPQPTEYRTLALRHDGKVMKPFRG